MTDCELPPSPCVGCGGVDMPLHTDYRCPNCHELDEHVDRVGPEWYGHIEETP